MDVQPCPTNGNSGSGAPSTPTGSLQDSSVSNRDPRKRELEQHADPETKRQATSAHSSQLSDSTPNVSTFNRYGPLSGLAENDSDESDSTPVQPRLIKPPPLFVHEVHKYKQLVSDLQKIASSKFTTLMKNNLVKVNTSSVDDYRLLVKFFKENNIQYHTFRDPSSKVKNAVIKNVPTDYSDEEIAADLEAQGIIASKVTRLYRKDRSPMPIVAVEVADSLILNELFKITTLFNALVFVELRSKSSSVVRCKRCQLTGHTRNYCHVTPKCAHCSQNHTGTRCPRLASPPLCANCQGPHAASDKRCPFYAARQAAFASRKTPARSYADMANTPAHVTSPAAFHSQRPPLPTPTTLPLSRPTSTPQNFSSPAPSSLAPPHSNHPNIDLSTIIQQIISSIIPVIQNVVHSILQPLLPHIIHSTRHGP